MKNKEKGILGEQIATNFLIKKGFQILEKNYRVGRHEIDIIAKKENLVVFVEVKLRKNENFGFPEAQVNHKKEEHIRNVADYFLEQNPQFFEIRFDIISIILEPKTEIVHLEDVF